MHKYYQPIADNDLMLQISSDFENDLGNLVTDCIRNQTKADFSILNPGGFRSPIAPGEVNYADLYSVFPFANTVQTFEMTGQELFEAVSIVQHGKKGLYQTSGLAMQLVSAGRLLKSLTFFNGSAVTGGAVLRGSSIDFLL